MKRSWKRFSHNHLWSYCARALTWRTLSACYIILKDVWAILLYNIASINWSWKHAFNHSYLQSGWGLDFDWVTFFLIHFCCRFAAELVIIVLLLDFATVRQTHSHLTLKYTPFWNKGLPLSISGQICLVKINVLPKLSFLFPCVPIFFYLQILFQETWFDLRVCLE